MQLLADESCDFSVVRALRAAGHDVKAVAEVALGVTDDIARDIGVPPRRINEIVQGKRAITADTALRLAKYFDMSESFWMGLQADYDLENVRKDLGKRLERISRHAA